MRKKLVNTSYTQINTNETEYIIQNLSKEDIELIIGIVEPESDAGPDFILKPKYGITNKDIETTVWGKCESAMIYVGLAEG